MNTDRSTVQAVVYLLGVITLACIAAATYLIDSGRSGTDVGTMLGFAGVGIGALGAILAHTGSGIGAVAVQPPVTLMAPDAPDQASAVAPGPSGPPTAQQPLVPVTVPQGHVEVIPAGP